MGQARQAGQGDGHGDRRTGAAQVKKPPNTIFAVVDDAGFVWDVGNNRNAALAHRQYYETAEEKCGPYRIAKYVLAPAAKKGVRK